MKKILNEKLGKFSAAVLKITAPMVIFQSLYLLAYIIEKDTYTVLSSSSFVYAIAESVMAGLLMSIGAVFMFDYLERRNK